MIVECSGRVEKLTVHCHLPATRSLIFVQLNPLISYQAPRLSQSYAHISQHGTTPIFELKNRWKTYSQLLVQIEQFIIRFHL